jgi:hypothetical protein
MIKIDSQMLGRSFFRTMFEGISGGELVKEVVNIVKWSVLQID